MKHALSIGLLVLACVAGCGEDGPIKAVTTKINCHDVCGRYKDCLDSNYDVDGCVTRCEQQAASEEKDQKLKTCETCLDDKSCKASVFNCATECAGIIP